MLKKFKILMIMILCSIAVGLLLKAGFDIYQNPTQVYKYRYTCSNMFITPYYSDIHQKNGVLYNSLYVYTIPANVSCLKDGIIGQVAE